VGEIDSSGRMVFSQENPLISPRRLSSNPNGDKTGPDHAPSGVFSGYINDEFKIRPPNEPPSNRNSFCSQGSNNAESTSSNFSSSISQYLHVFRNSPPHSNMQSTLSINTDHNTAVKTPLSGDTDEHTATDIRNRNNSDANLHDGVVIANFDYFFAEDGLIAYLPDKLALILKEAIYLFNLKPNLAKEFLISKRVISDSPSEFADFIFTHSNGQSKLSKRRIGEFVGNSNQFNQDVLNCFLSKFDFTNMALDEAIRSLVRQFRLPGEAQQIDRILEKFSKLYYIQNTAIAGKKGAASTAIKSADVAYILSFSILMLNTDLHNPSVAMKNKMTVQEFIRNNRGINGGLDVPAEHLESLYLRIKNDEIKMDMADMLESDVPAFMAPIMAGYLFKLYHLAMVPFWKKRWFILNDGCLYYFNKPYETNPKCIMPLENIRIEVQSCSSSAVASAGLEKNSSIGNLQEFGNVAKRSVKGRVTYTDNIGVDSSSSSNDCVLIVHGAASNGLLKSSKLTKKGGMTLAPRSRLVLRATSVAERDEWLAALQLDTQSFDPLKNAPLAKGVRDSMIGVDKTNAASSQKSRYDTEICSSSSGSARSISECSNSGTIDYTRRLSATSCFSDMENDGSLNSARSVVSWSSDHSVCDGEMSSSHSLSPEPMHSGASSNNSINNAAKWSNTFGSSFHRQKNVSWPYGSPGTSEKLPTGSSKVVNISAAPDPSSNRISANRKPSSSSILSFASGRSGTHSTQSGHSDETILFGMSEILLEGCIYRYVVPSKLCASSCASGKDSEDDLSSGITEHLSEPPTPSAVGVREREGKKDRRSLDSVLWPTSVLKSAHKSFNSSPDLTTTNDRSGVEDNLASVRSAHSGDLSHPSLLRALYASSDGAKRHYSVSAIPTPPPAPATLCKDTIPYSESLTAHSAPARCSSVVDALMGSDTVDQVLPSKVKPVTPLEVAIPSSNYNADGTRGGVNTASDLTSDSSDAVELECVRDKQGEDVTDIAAKTGPVSSAVNGYKSRTSSTTPLSICVDSLAIDTSAAQQPSRSISGGNVTDRKGMREVEIMTPIKGSNSNQSLFSFSSTVTPEKGNISICEASGDVKGSNTSEFKLKSMWEETTSPEDRDVTMKNSALRSLNPRKKLSLYLEDSPPAPTAQLSNLLGRDRHSMDNFSSSNNDCGKNSTNHPIPALTFQGSKNNKSTDALPASQLGIDISMGSVGGAHVHGQGSGSASISGPIAHAKHFSGLKDVKKWKRMYLTLLSDADGKGDILFYFPDEEVT
jgi:Sec7 domain/PH domain